MNQHIRSVVCPFSARYVESVGLQTISICAISVYHFMMKHATLALGSTGQQQLKHVKIVIAPCSWSYSGSALNPAFDPPTAAASACKITSMASVTSTHPVSATSTFGKACLHDWNNIRNFNSGYLYGTTSSIAVSSWRRSSNRVGPCTHYLMEEATVVADIWSGDQTGLWAGLD